MNLRKDHYQNIKQCLIHTYMYLNTPICVVLEPLNRGALPAIDGVVEGVGCAS